MSIKFKSSIDSEGRIVQSKHRAIKHTDTVQTLEVKVVTKTAAHPYHGSGSNYGYTIDGVEGAYLELTPGITYRFDQSDASNGGTGTGGHAHPLRFATAKDAAGSTAYTGSEVTPNGSPGSSGAYTQIAPTTSTPTILHYYCSSHNGMGSYAKFGTQSATDLTGFDTDDLAEGSTNKYLTQANLGQRSIGDLSDVNTTGVANNKILKYDSSTSKFIIADDGGSSSSSLTIQEEGNPLSTAATTLNFVGSGVLAQGNGATKTITISGGGSSGQVTVQKNVSGTSPTEATDGSRTDFTITSTPASKNNLQIYIDGVYQAKTAFEVSGTTVALDAAPASGAVVEIIHFTVIDANIFLQSHTATSSQTSFNAGGVIANINDTQVYIDGVYQNKGNYTISGSNVVLNPAPATGAVVEIVNIKASTTSSGSITWDTTGIKTANFNAAAGKGYFVNTTSGDVIVTLPTASAGDEIHFTDYASTFDTNKIAFFSSQKIQGRATSARCTIENAVVRLIYQDDTKGWTADNIVDDPPNFALKYLVVGAGGAGGGNWRSGGGGGGAVRTNFAAQGGGVAQDSTTISLQPSTITTYAVAIGVGGAGAANADGSKGGDSSFTYSSTTITSNGGGGGGGAYNTAGAPAHGGNASGGGGDGSGGEAGAAGGTYGYAGGSGASGGTQCGGGGGGAGAVGQNGGSGATSGDGGNGVIVNIVPATSIGTGTGQVNIGEVSSSNVYYGGGGGGGSYSSGNNAIPGLGGGGDGGYGTNSTNGDAADPGAANTGGGGGGSYSEAGAYGNGTGGAGGSGVVILRYPAQVDTTGNGTPDTNLTANIQSGGNLQQHANSPLTVGSDKMSVFISGSGNIKFELG
jgi:hypothetical protein